MGRNKALRKKMTAQEEVVEEHEERIRREQMKPTPNESYIRGWRREIDTARENIGRLVRRLKRER
jgi:hypothetical protein